ncbi:MAG: hypothetical protein WC582_01370 [Patescibacteria group bacterium]
MNSIAVKPKRAVVRRQLIDSTRNVLVEVPKTGLFVKWINEFTPDGATNPVPGHYQQGVLLQDGGDSKMIVFVHYYVDTADLGRKICAGVDTFEKEMDDGTIYIYVDVHPCKPNHDDPFVVMKFKRNSDRGILIPATNFYLRFNRTAAPE